MNKDKTQKYWEARQEQKILSFEKKADEYYGELEKAFERARKDIETEINRFYIRYADANGVSFSMAQKMLKREEIGELKDFIARAMQSIGKYDLELENMSIKARVTRYEALKMQMDVILQNLYAVDYEKNAANTLKDIYSDSYYRTWHSIDAYKGFHSNFAQVDTVAVDELIKYPFNGADFSTRLWNQKEHMLTKLSESLTVMLTQGKNPATLYKDFAKTFGVKKHEAYRLLYTEAAFISEEASQTMYQEDGVEKYEIIATLDTKTSETCRRQDGKIYKVEDRKTGLNAPPFHMWCRTTTGPWYDDVDLSDQKRVARDENGNIYEVPADMNYEQWYDKHIEAPKLSDKKWLNSTFQTKKKFEGHYKKHKDFYPGLSPEEYLNEARVLLAADLSDDIEGFIGRSGFVFKYKKSTNDMAIGHSGGAISTLFKPDEKYDYWINEIAKHKR